MYICSGGGALSSGSVSVMEVTVSSRSVSSPVSDGFGRWIRLIRLAVKQKHYILEASSVEDLIGIQESVLEKSPGMRVVFKRYFLSDISQRAALPVENGAVSYVVQPPLDGSAVGVWLYLAGDAEVEYGDGYTIVRDGGLEHIWSAGMVSPLDGSHAQTDDILTRYESFLKGRNASLSGDCVRTWFFVDDIDNNYAGMVDARREFFTSCGLTPATHYIASTGICGMPVPYGNADFRSAVSAAVVQLDAWAIKGRPAHRYLYAPTHLNPTYEYGVTFERGVKVDYSGCSHVIISGTASIDQKGDVLYPGDVRRQTLRMWDNVEALLVEGGAGWEHVKMVTVYLRNREDYPAVADMFSAKFPDTPYIITLAPVCRPAWLIEMECIAVR